LHLRHVGLDMCEALALARAQKITPDIVNLLSSTYTPWNLKLCLLWCNKSQVHGDYEVVLMSRDTEDYKPYC